MIIRDLFTQTGFISLGLSAYTYTSLSESWKYSLQSEEKCWGTCRKFTQVSVKHWLVTILHSSHTLSCQRRKMLYWACWHILRKRYRPQQKNATKLIMFPIVCWVHQLLSAMIVWVKSSVQDWVQCKIDSGVGLSSLLQRIGNSVWVYSVDSILCVTMWLRQPLHHA